MLILCERLRARGKHNALREYAPSKWWYYDTVRHQRTNVRARMRGSKDLIAKDGGMHRLDVLHFH